jgi:hypothetical protein
LHGELTLAKVQLAEAREEIGALEPQRAKKGTGVKPLSLGPRRAHHERTKRLGRGQARRASKRRELLEQSGPASPARATDGRHRSGKVDLVLGTFNEVTRDPNIKTD